MRKVNRKSGEYATLSRVRSAQNKISLKKIKKKPQNFNQ